MSKRIGLNGTWKLTWSDLQRGDRVTRLHPLKADMTRAFDATVPGEIHLDMMKAGLIEEPAEGLNALAARWVEENVWRYRRTFKTPKMKKGERCFIVFECLDLAAIVFLNGKEVGRHTNAFYPCVLDVTGHLAETENVLVVEIECGLYHVAEKPIHSYCGPENTLNKRHWLRKTQSQFGWDWSLRLGNVGITGNVYLEVAETVRVDSVAVVPALAADLEHGSVKVRLAVNGLEDKPRKGVVVIDVAKAGVHVEMPVEIKHGEQVLEAVAEVVRPDLWWPVNHGAQPLYEVKATLTVGGLKMSETRKKVGFRHVRVNQDPHPEKGRYFIIEINGRPVFAKGGNMVPADMIFARIDRKRYETLVDRALESNFNFLRVWGGGLYESDDFYEICDEKGVLVWQEFVFACARYPAIDEKFLADVRKEATYQVRRLANHPSLVIWCGNNEMEWGCWSWGFDRGTAYPDYSLFHLVFPTTLAQEDGTRYYQPSSPFSPDNKHPNADETGDQHPWSIGFGDNDFRKYRQMDCRFPNEGGILGPTALPTVKACLPKGQDYPGSFAWENHDNSVSYWGDGALYPDAMLEQWLGKKLENLSIEDYVYWAGVVQGQGLGEYIRNFRRRMFNDSAAIFWMYNDCWPMVRSWTTVDYYLRRTPAFHPVRRAFQPVTVAVVVEGGRVNVYGINDTPETWSGELRFGLFGVAGGLPVDRVEKVTLQANRSAVLASWSEAAWKKFGEKTHGAFAILSADGQEKARDVLFMPFFKDMKWAKPELKVRMAKGKAVFTSRSFSWRVCLDLDGEKRLPDNFFDVLPGIPTVLDWPARLGTPKVLRVGNLR